MPSGLALDPRLGHIVWACALTLCSSYVKLISLNREGGGIPLGRYPAHCLSARLPAAEVKHGNRVRAGVCGKEPPAILRYRDRVRHRTKVGLPGKARIVDCLQLEFTSAHTHRGHRIPVGQGDIKSLLVRAPGKSSRMRTG